MYGQQQAGYNNSSGKGGSMNNMGWNNNGKGQPQWDNAEDYSDNYNSSKGGNSQNNNWNTQQNQNWQQNSPMSKGNNTTQQSWSMNKGAPQQGPMMAKGSSMAKGSPASSDGGFNSSPPQKGSNVIINGKPQQTQQTRFDGASNNYSSGKGMGSQQQNMMASNKGAKPIMALQNQGSGDMNNMSKMGGAACKGGPNNMGGNMNMQKGGNSNSNLSNSGPMMAPQPPMGSKGQQSGTKGQQQSLNQATAPSAKNNFNSAPSWASAGNNNLSPLKMTTNNQLQSPLSTGAPNSPSSNLFSFDGSSMPASPFANTGSPFGAAPPSPFSQQNIGGVGGAGANFGILPGLNNLMSTMLSGSSPMGGPLGGDNLNSLNMAGLKDHNTGMNTNGGMEQPQFPM
jgi:hypothetical protein